MFVRVRLLKPWKGYDAGRIFNEVSPGEADALVRRGKAEVLRSGDTEQPPAGQSVRQPAAQACAAKGATKKR